MTILPEYIFIRTLQTLPDQDERTLKPWINAHNLVKVQGKWWKDNCKVITTNLTDWCCLISQYHDPPTMGHPGISRTTQLIRQPLWWPKLASEVEQYVKGCPECQRNKTNTQGKKAPLSPIFPQLNARPFATIAMDFIVKLPLSQGYDSILTITDQGCTKMAVFLPCNETINAEGVAQLCTSITCFQDLVYPLRSSPIEIHDLCHNS